MEQLLTVETRTKLRDVRHEDIPEINNPKIRFPVLEGDYNFIPDISCLIPLFKIIIQK